MGVLIGRKVGYDGETFDSVVYTLDLEQRQDLRLVSQGSGYQEPTDASLEVVLKR